MQIIEDIKLDFSDVLIRPKRSKTASRADIVMERTFRFLNSKNVWHGIPIMAANLDSVGTFSVAKALSKFKLMTCLHKHYSPERLIDFFQNEEWNNNTFYTLGIKKDDFEKLFYIKKQVTIKNICVDVANGNSEHFQDQVKTVRDAFPNSNIMCGNVATPELVQELLLSGAADIVKIGIGSGSLCMTRIVTGCGYPQLSAVIECSEAAHALNGHVVSDGGITCAGDVAKAFGGGADFVMIGGLFGGHDECEGIWEVNSDTGEKNLTIYGMSSEIANKKYNGGLKDYRSPEGKQAKVQYKGSIDKTIQYILGGVRSAASYMGAKNVKNIPKCCTFLRVNRQSNEVFGCNSHSTLYNEEE